MAGRRSATTSQEDQVRHSGRLAGKATSGLSAMEKAQFVLLKRAGFCSDEAPPLEKEIQCYKEMYNKPLPPDFIKAVTTLVEAGLPQKVKNKAAAPSQASPLVAQV